MASNLEAMATNKQHFSTTQLQLGVSTPFLKLRSACVCRRQCAAKHEAPTDMTEEKPATTTTWCNCFAQTVQNVAEGDMEELQQELPEEADLATR